MQGSLFAVIAVVLILLLVLVWLNIMMVRRGKKQSSSDGSPGRSRGAVAEKERSEPASVNTDPEDSTASKSHTTDGNKTEPLADSRDSGPPKKSHRKSEGMQRASTSQATDPRQEVAEEPSEDADVEVVHSDYRSRQAQGNKVFDRNPLPYFLHGASVPEFDSSAWHDVFMRLSEDSNVMGWVAFHNDTAGASDREYEFGFLDVLRSYKRSVSSLQREVGLSQVLETSVVGEEGKIWFLTGSQEHWFALFVDRNSDVHEIVKPFMKRLLSGDENEH